MESEYINQQQNVNNPQTTSNPQDMEQGSKGILATNIEHMQNPESYEEFQKGAFPQVPNMSGYTLRFKGFKQYEVYLVLNTAEGFEYDTPLVEEGNFVIMVINIYSLEYFLQNIQQYTQPILEVLQDIANKDNVTDRELPYGYVRDENGKIKINPAEAVIVKKIFKTYPSYKSIRKVAQEIRTDYSFVHDILHDARYSRMPVSIVPEVDIRRAYQVIQANRRNKHTKKRVRRLY